MEDAKMRKMRFWVAAGVDGTLVTAMNKKQLREKMGDVKEGPFKGTKIRQLELSYQNHADLAAILLSHIIEDLTECAAINVISEYNA